MIANWWEETKNMNLFFPSQNVKSWLVSKAQISIIVTCWIFAPKSTRSRAKLMSNDWRKTIVLSTDAFQNHSGGRAQLRQIIKPRQKIVKLTDHTYASNLRKRKCWTLFEKNLRDHIKWINFWLILAIWNHCAFQNHSSGLGEKHRVLL